MLTSKWQRYYISLFSKLVKDGGKGGEGQKTSKFLQPDFQKINIYLHAILRSKNYGLNVISTNFKKQLLSEYQNRDW